MQTAAITGVPHDTIKNWRKQPWWLEIVEQFHDDDKQELDAKYQKIIRKALAVVDDRLENGNFQMDQKTGQIVRVPVSISDSHKVMKDLVDQQQVLRIDKKQVQIQQETINDKLIKLAEQFALMAAGKNNEKVVSGETYDMQLHALEQINNDSFPVDIDLNDPQGDKTVEVIPEYTPKASSPS